MSKPFDYSKWDNIEISDDEDDVHPNIDRESWFRMKHRSRVEREENEAKDKANIQKEMEKANQRIKILQHDLDRMKKEAKAQRLDGDDDDDDDLDECEGLEAEIRDLQTANAARQAKLDEYEKKKKWNVDNMFQVKEERTIINPTAGKVGYTETGYIRPKEEQQQQTEQTTEATKTDSSQSSKSKTSTTTTTASSTSTTNSKKAASTEPKKTASASSKPVASKSTSSASAAAAPPAVELGAMETYHEFTEKYADVVEQFMAIPDLEGSKQFLLQHAEILLQENASNYLLLASLEDEMNGYRDKMKRTAQKSQIVSSIAEMAKTVKTHPGNVIMPFFQRLQQREHLEEFVAGVNTFCDKIIQRAIVKKQEIDAARQQQQQQADGEDEQQDEGTASKSLEDIPREERLGPGGLDPLEVIETLPAEMVKAFESRDVDRLKEALMKLNPADAEYHMKRCIDSGLWVANASS